MIIISYYTPGNYEKVMNTHLRPSLEKWKLKHYIREVENKGNWYHNTSYKAQFILDCLKEYKEDVCFLDADAVIEQYPQLLFHIPNIFPCACHFLDWYRFWRGKSGCKKFELLSGTIIFKYNKIGLALAERYLHEVKKNPTKWEQKTLQEIVEKERVPVYNLPACYCAIIRQDGTIPDYIGKPIITHHQASRKFKR